MSKNFFFLNQKKISDPNSKYLTNQPGLGGLNDLENRSNKNV